MPSALIVTGLRIHDDVFLNINTHLRVDEILAGCLLSIIWSHRSNSSKIVLKTLKSLFWPTTLLWLASCHPFMQPLGYFRPYFTLALIGAVLAMKSEWQKRFLSTKIFRHIALISFALYVFHSPFRHGWFDSGTDIERYLIKRPLAFLSIFILAHVSTFYLEKPIVNKVKKLTSRSLGV